MQRISSAAAIMPWYRRHSPASAEIILLKKPEIMTLLSHYWRYEINYFAMPETRRVGCRRVGARHAEKRRRPPHDKASSLMLRRCRRQCKCRAGGRRGARNAPRCVYRGEAANCASADAAIGCSTKSDGVEEMAVICSAYSDEAFGGKPCVVLDRVQSFEKVAEPPACAAPSRASSMQVLSSGQRANSTGYSARSAHAHCIVGLPHQTDAARQAPSRSEGNHQITHRHQAAGLRWRELHRPAWHAAASGLPLLFQYVIIIGFQCDDRYSRVS